MRREVNKAAKVTVVKKVTGADVKAIGFRTMANLKHLDMLVLRFERGPE